MAQRFALALLLSLLGIGMADAKPKKNPAKPAPTQSPQQEDEFKLEVEFDDPPAKPDNAKPQAGGKSPYAFVVAQHKWDRDQPAVKLIANEAGFGFLSELTGNMAGYGESVAVSLGFDGNWHLSGTTQQPLAASAVSVATKLRGEFESRPAEYKWAKGSGPVKMIHKSEGLCFLSSVAGTFRGYGESVRVYVNPDDGFWYLDGHAVQDVSAKALALKLRKGVKVKLEYAEHAWSRGQEPVKLIHKDEGFAFLSSVAGNFLGFGEGVNLTIGDDGFWRLNGVAQQDLAARAIIVHVRK